MAAVRALVAGVGTSANVDIPAPFGYITTRMGIKDVRTGDDGEPRVGVAAVAPAGTDALGQSRDEWTLSRRERVRFSSRGHWLAGDLFIPDGQAAGGKVPAVVQGPGWLGLRDAKLYRPYHCALVATGFAVLTLDYRGFGDSEGDASFLDPREQVEDIRAGLTYLESRQEIDPRRIGIFGSGGTGGGNAVMAAGLDERVRAVVSQVPIGDGHHWLRGMRDEDAWTRFLDRLRADRLRRVAAGAGESVSPRDEIMVPSPERRTTTIKADVDGRIPSLVELSSAQAVMDYRPIDVVHRISPRPLLLICVEGDDTTPEDQAFALYEAADEPKRLIVQTGTSHYRAYADFEHIIPELIAQWFQRYMVAEEPSDDPAGGSIQYLSPS